MAGITYFSQKHYQGWFMYMRYTQGQNEEYLLSRSMYSTMPVRTVEPPNTGHFGDNLNSADMLFVERFSSVGGSNRMYYRNYTGTASNVLCREVIIFCVLILGESTIGGSTVL